MEAMPLDENDILILKGMIQEELKDVKHACAQEGILGELTGITQRMSKDVYGNGHEGLTITVPRLADKIDGQTKALEELEDAISGVMQFVHETTGEKAGEERLREKQIKAHAERRADKLKMLQVISTIVAALVLIATLTLGILNYNKEKRLEQMQIEKMK